MISPLRHARNLGVLVSLALVGSAAAITAPADAGLQRVHRAVSTASAPSGQGNFFDEMEIGDVGLGLNAGSATDPEDGLGDVIGVTSATTGGQAAGLHRILQASPNGGPWTRTGVSATGPSTDLATTFDRPAMQAQNGNYFSWLWSGVGYVHSGISFNGRNGGSGQDSVVRDHPPVALDLGFIMSSPAAVQGGALLLDDDRIAIWTNQFTQLTGPGPYLDAPTGTNRVCGGKIRLADVTGDAVDDIVQWGNRCGGGDSGFQVWSGGPGSNAASWTYRGYFSTGPNLRDLQIGDLSGDGKNDLAFTFASSLTSGNGEYAVALFDASRSLDNVPALHFAFQPSDAGSVERIALPGGAGALQIGDLAAPSNPNADGDGRADLVIAQPQSKQIRVLANGVSTPAGEQFAPFGAPTPFGDGTITGPDGIDLGKINTDARPDLLAWSSSATVGDWEVFTASRAPTVSLTPSATKVFKDTGTVTYTATATAPSGSSEDADVESVEWDFDGNGTTDETTTALTVDHVFTSTGLKDTKATIVNAAGDRATASLSAPVAVGTPLSVTISPKSTTTTPGAATDFTATATGGYPGSGGTTTYTYAFTNDATTASTPVAGVLRATWSAPKAGNVGVTATDGQGQSATDASEVRVANAMTASLAPQNARNLMAGEARVLVASAAGGIPPLSYAWDLDGDGSYETDTAQTAQVSKTFASAGSPTVGLRVTDADPRGGVTKTATATLSVRSALDAVVTRTPAAPAPGAAVTFTSDDSTGGEPLGATPYTYAWTLDGTPLTSETTDTLSRTFAAPGRHTVGLTITDAYGRTDSATSAFTVAADLVADFSNTPLDPQLGETVTFDVAPTAGGLAPYMLRWDLDGDGTFDAAQADKPRPTATYATSGIRQITLEVTDDDGEISTVTKPLGVAAELTAALRLLPAQPRPGTVTTFDGTVTVGGTRPYAYEWTLDGTVLTGSADTGAQLTRTFAQPGHHHRIALKVTDAAGRTSTAAEQDVRVADPVLPEFTSTPRQPETGQDVSFDAAPSTGGVPPLRYAWDRDGDGTYETDTGATATDRFSFRTPGVHVVGLRTTDADGVAATVTHNVTVAPALTAALTHSPPIPAPGTPVTLDASASSGGAGALAFAFDIDAAGTFALSAGPSTTATRIFTDRGDHAIAVRVRDQGGHEQVARDVVTVADPLKAALAVTPANPETGDTLRIDATGSAGGVGALSYAFDLDGDGRPDGAASSAATVTQKVDAPGAVRLGVTVGDTRGQQASAVAGVMVTPRLEPAFAVPSVVTDDQPSTFDASGTTGGAAPLTFRWDLDGNGSFETDAGSRPTQDGRFTKPGTFAVGLQVTDALGHVRDVRRSFEVVTGCVRSVDYGLAQIRAADGVCLRRESPAAGAPLEANGDIIVNGMRMLKQAGAALSVYPPVGDATARIVSTAVRVQADGANIVDGAINWRLPVGEPGEERTIAGVGLGPDGVELLGLEVEGRIAFALGTSADRKPYVRVSVNMVIPGFKLTDEANSPGVTGKLSFRIDRDGPHFDAVKIQVTHAKLKGLDVNDICLSYVAAGQEGDQCEQFADHSGEPFLTCATDESTDRWNGTMDITLPSANGAGFAFSGELQNGSLGNIAAKAELGHMVPIGEGVYLKSIAAGVCLKPAPLKIRGQAVISAVPLGSDDAIEVSGGFLYVDAAGNEPWSIELQGGLTMFDHHIAEGRATLAGDGSLGVGLHARLQLPNDDVDVASIDGRIDGWMKGRAFNVEGSVEACLLAAICRGGEALVSTDGVAACATILSVYYPVVDVGWLYTDVSFEKYDIRGGFGYRWGGGVDAMGGSCDIGPWRPAGAPIAVRSQVGGSSVTSQYTFDVEDGSILENLKVAGAGGAAPDIVVTGPDGTRLETSELLGQPAPQELGKPLIMKDPQAGSTIVQLIKPAAGTWTVTAKPGSLLAKIERAPLMLPPAVGGRVRENRWGHHLDFAYTPQPGVELKFIERRGDFAQSIGAGKMLDECRQEVDRRTKRDVSLTCGRVDFTPAEGPAGKRQIDVQITRNGVPIATQKIATFTVEPPARPTRVKATLKRSASGYPKLSWTKSRRAIGYEVTATSPEGYRQVWQLPAKCRAVTLPVTQAARSVKVSVKPVAAKNRPAGPTAKLSLKSKKKTAGAKSTGKTPRSCR